MKRKEPSIQPTVQRSFVYFDYVGAAHPTFVPVNTKRVEGKCDYLLYNKITKVCEPCQENAESYSYGKNGKKIIYLCEKHKEFVLDCFEP